MIYKKIVIILLTFIVTYITIQGRLYSANMFDPELKWKSLETDHFWIHFHQGLEDEAVRLSRIAEKVHYRLKDIILWEPYLKTDVVLIDNMDIANGFALPFPSNRVQIWISRPNFNDVLNNFDDWMELVFTHEYTHILNIDTVHGFPSISRYTCGRLCFPNLFLPIWMLEGNAVYNESIYSKYGRNNSSYTDMVMRIEVLSDEFKSITEACGFPREWPVGNVPYLYGGLFVDFLEKKYGKGRIADVFIGNSYNILPYSDNIIPYILPYISDVIPFLKSSERIVFDESFINLWEEWKEYIIIKYKRQITRVSGDGLTEFIRITDSGYQTSLPRFSRDGGSIYFVRITDYNKSVLMKYSINKHRVEELCKINYPSSIAVSRQDGELYLSDIEFFRSFSLYNEAFKFDREGYKRLTNRLRGSHIDISSDGKRAVFVKQDRNRYSIIISNINFDSLKPIIRNSNIQIAFTRFSPDGNRIVFSFKDRKGNTDLALLDVADREILRLTHDQFNDIEPAWHPDGKRIIFSSDRDGVVYNLYELNLDKKTILKITKLVGGAFSPDISPDGEKITFSSYGKGGFDIALMMYPDSPLPDVNVGSEEIDGPLPDMDVETVKIESISHGFFYSENDEKIPEQKMMVVDYSPWNSILPHFWIPIIATEEIYDDKYDYWFSFILQGTDTLFQHLYSLYFEISNIQKRASVECMYLLSTFYPEIVFDYKNNAIFYGDDEFPWEDENQISTRRTLSKSGSIGIWVPFNYVQRRHGILFSYRYKKIYTDWYWYNPYGPYSIIDYTNTLARVRCGYVFDTTNTYSFSISKEDGREFYMIFDMFNKYIASDFSYCKVRGEYSEFLPGIARNNVIMLRLQGGASFENPGYLDPYTLGKFEKGEQGSPSSGEAEFGLRGYPAGLIYGNRVASGAIEYRFPVLQVDFGFATFPLMFRDLWLNIFCEYGNVWTERKSHSGMQYHDLKEFRSSSGIELHMKITLGYRLDLHGYIGYARGFNEYGEDQVYFSIGTLIEGALGNKHGWIKYL